MTRPNPNARRRIDEARLRELHNRGASDGQIAAATGVTRNGVQAARERLGLAANYRVGEKPRAMTETA